MEPIPSIAAWLATLSVKDYVLDRCKDHLKEASEQGVLALIKRFLTKRQDDRLPQNHDLENASRDALAEALRALLLGIRAHLDPKPPLFDAIREHLQNGSLTDQPLIQLRDSPSHNWVNTLQTICYDRSALKRLTHHALSTEVDFKQLLAREKPQNTEKELQRCFTDWLDREMQGIPGRPDFLDDLLQNGWPIEKDGRQRVTLYQVWCLFFREKLKHKTEVFRILVADTVVETAKDVKELRTLAAKQISSDDFHRWIELRLGALQDWLAAQFDKVHDEHQIQRKLLDEIKQQTANLAPPQSKGIPNNLAFVSIGPLFKGRDADLEAIYTQIQTKRPLVIHGLGGVGKTRLTIEYALTHSNDYSALLSVGANAPESLNSNLAVLCALLGLPEQSTKEQDLQCQAALRWLNDHPGWLLLLDNADSNAAADAVAELLPRLRGGHVIVTSRISQWPKGVNDLPLEELSLSAAVEFLLQATEGKRVTTATDSTDAAALAADVGYLALALEQATAFIATKRITLAAYRARWQEREASVRGWYDARTMQYDKSIAIAWDTTFQQLSSPAQALLRVMCWLAPDAIPRSLLETDETAKLLADPSPDTPTTASAVTDALAELAGFSLLKWDRGFTSFRIHRLVQEVTQDQIESGHRKYFIKVVLNILGNALPAQPPPNDVLSWPIWEPLQAHIASTIRAADSAGITDPTALLMSSLGLFFKTKCIWDQAEMLYRRALAIYEATFGNEYPNFSANLNNLANLLQETNRLTEAEPMMRRALAIVEASFGFEHPTVAIQLNNLAHLLQATNRLTEAESLIRRALAIDEASYGTEHPKVAIRLNNLAQLLQDTNRLTEAEPLMRRVLAIDEASFGSEHPNVAACLNNLAALLHANNQLAEAEPLMRHALAIDEASFGAEHPRVAIDLGNLAALLLAASRLAEAEPLMRRALAIDEASFDSEHPKVASHLNNLAQLLRAANRLAEAEPLMRRNVEILLRFKQLTGHDHPNLAAGAKNYFFMLEELGFTPAQIQTRLAELTARFETNS